MKAAEQRLRYIAVEGPIGAGKTTLARRLAAHTGGELVLEQPETNPFLERFYRDRARYALPTQVFFLLQRAQQLRQLMQRESFATPVIADFLLEKDPLFARLTLADDELALYERIYAQLAPQAAAPDLVIYLQASPAALVERVARRGNAYEAGITESYLRAVAESYAHFFHRYEAAPVLVVNTENLNPIERDADFELLLARVERMRGRREYFDLAA